jgi:putative NADH-flavin reductase
MQRIALFGGSGGSGQAFLIQALEAGYSIRALARTPSKISQVHDHLEIIQGDVLNPDDVHKTMEDCDLVVSLFGQVKGSPPDLQTRGTHHIVEAMQKKGIQKIISLSGGGLPFEKDQPKFADKMIRGLMQLVARNMLVDAKGHAEVLRKSGLDWIVVRGPRLTDGPAKGSYQVGWVGTTGGTQIRRADLAHFILQQVERDRFIHQMPFVSY